MSESVAEERRQARANAHSLELRQVLALEQIADELTVLRLLIPSQAAPSPQVGGIENFSSEPR